MKVLTKLIVSSNFSCLKKKETNKWKSSVFLPKYDDLHNQIKYVCVCRKTSKHFKTNCKK